MSNDLADFDFVFLLDLGHDAFATVYLLIGRSFQLMQSWIADLNVEFVLFDGLTAARYYFLAITDSLMILYQHD